MAGEAVQEEGADSTVCTPNRVSKRVNNRVSKREASGLRPDPWGLEGGLVRRLNPVAHVAARGRVRCIAIAFVHRAMRRTSGSHLRVTMLQ